MSLVPELSNQYANADFDAFIASLRAAVEAERRTLTDPLVKTWCGQRWRDLFLTEAAKDDKAVETASAVVGLMQGIPTLNLGKDKRSVRQRLAERFLAENILDWKLELPPPPSLNQPDPTIVFCPGFIHRAIPTPGLAELADIERDYGLRVLRADAHGFRGCSDNVPDLLATIEHGTGEDDAGAVITDPVAPRDVVLIGYSKGSPDALTLLAQEPNVASRVRALVCWAGAVGGSPTADDVYETIKDINLSAVVNNDVVLTVLKALLPIAQLDGLLERTDEWDLKGAIRDLSTTARSAFLADHAAAIDALDVPIFHVIGRTSPLEVPYFQLQGTLEITRRVGANDMQVAVEHAQMRTPMATTLAVCRAHHWDLALGPFPATHRLGSPNLNHPFPRRAALTATVLLLAELGLLANRPDARPNGA